MWGRDWLVSHCVLVCFAFTIVWGCEGEHREYTYAGPLQPQLGADMSAADAAVVSDSARGDQTSSLLSADNRCVPNPCLNNGGCRGDGSCACTPGFSGERCQIN